MISRIMSSEHSLPNSLSQHELESAADDNIKTESTAEARARESVPGTSGQLCLRLRAVRKRARPCDAVKGKYNVPLCTLYHHYTHHGPSTITPLY